MGSLTLNVSVQTDPSLVISPAELVDLYFFGISLSTQDGRVLSDRVLLQKIKYAQKQVENTLQIKLTRQIVEESSNFVREEFKSWGYVRVGFPVEKVYKLEGYLNETRQIQYPQTWLVTRKDNGTPIYFKNIYIVANGSQGTTVNQDAIVYTGLTPHIGLMGFSFIPNYWRSTYCTGFDSIPEDISDFIGRLASIQIFSILGDILLGAGIASQSLSVDGLSQSVNTTQSAENSAFSARTKQYLSEMKLELPILKSTYRGFIFNSF